MSGMYFFILLLVMGFADWKALDYFQLPNTFQYFDLLILTRTFWPFYGAIIILR